jgi:hypothetical protein
MATKKTAPPKKGAKKGEATAAPKPKVKYDKINRVSAEADALVIEHAEAKGIDKYEAADQLVRVGFKRLGALAKYNGGKGKGAGKGAKKAPSKRAKPPRASKAAGAKAATKRAASTRKRTPAEPSPAPAPEFGKAPFDESAAASEEE